jgi:2-hydroxy-3-oxopropionate reductase
MNERIGFIGLGIMGKPMAKHLLAAGYPLTVRDLVPEPIEELVAAGASRGESGTAVAAASDVVITMLPDTSDVEAALFGADGVAEGVTPGSLVIEMSSIAPVPTRGFAERLAGQGVPMLDAPVSGGEKGAIEASLSIMVGGPDDVFDRALPILRLMGKNIVHVGSSGAGQVTKACNQLVVASTIEAVAEALLLARKAGVDPAKVRDALLGGFAGSRILELHGQRMLEGNFQPGFRIRLHRKDARIIEETAAAVGAPVPGFAPVADALRRLADAGRGDLDHSALLTLLEDEAGATVRASG